MECRDVRERLSAYVDHEVDPADGQAMARHLGECEPCRKEEGRLTAAMRTAERVLGGYRIEAPVERGALAGLSARRRRGAGGAGGIWPYALAAVALVLGVIGGYLGAILWEPSPGRAGWGGRSEWEGLFFVESAIGSAVRFALLLVFLPAVRRAGDRLASLGWRVLHWAGVILLPLAALALIPSLGIAIDAAFQPGRTIPREYAAAVILVATVFAGVTLWLVLAGLALAGDFLGRIEARLGDGRR